MLKAYLINKLNLNNLIRLEKNRLGNHMFVITGVRCSLTKLSNNFYMRPNMENYLSITTEFL
jgi:hypothetical protein